MELTESLKKRESKRWFNKKAIPDNLLKSIVKEAQQSPSWVNAQSVQVVIAKGEQLEKMRKQHASLNKYENEEIRSVIPYLPITKWPMREQRNMKNWFGNVRDVLGENQNAMSDAGNQLYNAQAVAYLTLPSDYSDWALIDLGIFAQSLMLSATAAGIGSIPAYQYVVYPDVLEENLGLSSDRVPVFGIGLGYFDEKNPLNQVHTDRVPVDETLKIIK